MRKMRPIATIADILIMAVVALVNPLNPFHNRYPGTPPRIPDKVEIRYTPNTAIDSTQQARLQCIMSLTRATTSSHAITKCSSRKPEAPTNQAKPATSSASPPRTVPCLLSG